MIAPTGSAVFAGARLARGAGRGWRVTVAVGPGGAGAAAAPPPRPRRPAAGLDGLLTDGAPLAAGIGAARAAARAFGAGDGFLPGQIIDRAI